MCVIAFVSAIIFNVQISPTFCEQYKKQNIIVKIFQIYSFGIQISFKNDSTGSKLLLVTCISTYRKDIFFYYLCLLLESLVKGPYYICGKML